MLRTHIDVNEDAFEWVTACGKEDEELNKTPRQIENSVDYYKYYERGERATNVGVWCRDCIAALPLALLAHTEL